VFYGLPAGERTVELAHAALEGRGYRLVEREGPRSPRLALPGSWDELLASRSRNLRSQLGRRKRNLEKQGTLEMRTFSALDDISGPLESLFRIEASGWKSEAGTAILEDPPAERLYRSFADHAARRGWLRIYLLELDGEPIAGDYGCVFGGGAFLIKTGFDDRRRDLSPGLVLRGEVLRASIEEEGCDFYDFLGPPDPYKLRWTDEVRPRLELRAYRGATELPRFLFRSRIRPALAAARERLRARKED
jgi:CelD/BcsL family acetyltransferase involved in cellulose biosynthesis